MGWLGGSDAFTCIELSIAGGPFVALYERPTIILTPVSLRFCFFRFLYSEKAVQNLQLIRFNRLLARAVFNHTMQKRRNRTQYRSAQSCIIEHVAEDLEPTKVLVCGVFIWGKTVTMPTTCKDARMLVIMANIPDECLSAIANLLSCNKFPSSTGNSRRQQ